MNVNKNLFMYGLVVVTIVRDEARYIKEWIEYHLLAGVDHFLIYDNDSLDDIRKEIGGYEEKNLVTVIPAPKTHRQLEAYNDAIKYFKYYCRYMAFIDVDEYILPRDGRDITEVVEEMKGAGLGIKLHTFGSNNEEKAERKGVLERFTRRAEEEWEGNAGIKVIVDPRRVKLFRDNPNKPEFIEGNELVMSEKMVINYYATYSREEYIEKVHRRETARFMKRSGVEGFDALNRNEIPDEKILKYREELRIAQNPEGKDLIKIYGVKNRINNGRLLKGLVESLTPGFDKNNLKKYFENPKNRATYFNDLIKLYRKVPPVLRGSTENQIKRLTLNLTATLI